MLNGKFEYETPALKLSQERIDLETDAGEVLHGNFTVSHPQERKVRGFLYSSNPRVTFDPLEFFGISNRIFYQIDTSGLREGEETDGCFTFCTDLGEYMIPYRIRIREKTPVDQVGKIDSTEALKELARQDFQSAYPVFTGAEFRQLLEEKEPDRLVLYDALKEASFHYQSLEEFFIGCGLKDPVELSLDSEELRMEAADHPVRETLTLHRGSWGFLKIEISSDCRFLRPEKKTITTDEFAGDQYELGFVIDSNFLHAGRNYGRIRVSTCYQTLCFEVTVSRCTDSESRRQHRVRKIMRKKLEGLYLDFRLKRMEMQPWIDRSLGVIDTYRRAGGSDVFADLMEIQLLFADDKRAKGYKLLQAVEKQPQRLNTPERYGFYLYVSTFFHRDAEYVDQVEARVEQLLLQNRDCWVLQWILLYLQERFLASPAAKLEAIGVQVRNGCSSPIMYLEAYLLLRKDPFLLRRLNAFELKVLSFAVRRGLMTQDLADQTANLALHQRGYSRALLEILENCYEVHRSLDTLKAVCTVLIAGDRREQECFEWYALGVGSDLRITGLYEYYMETMDVNGIEKMPQIIRMYFLYNNTMDYHRRARIYRNISDRREQIPQVYRSLREAIEKFLMEQMELGRIDENLAVLYERYVSRQLLNRPLAVKLAKMMFTFEVTCKNPNMKSIVVSHGDLKGEQTAVLSHGSAQVQIYTEDARIFLVDADGNRYASTSLYMAERLLDVPKLMTYCQELTPDYPGLVFYMSAAACRQGTADRKALAYLKAACNMDQLRDEYRKRCRRMVLEYYMEHMGDDDLFAYLKQIPYAEFEEADKKALLTLLTQEGMYEEAFTLLETYGSEQIPLIHLVRICSQTVLAREYEENAVLLAYCYQCYDYGKYDDNILTYLLMYYDGPIEDMKRLWNTGKQYELDTMVLEEKILSLLLFTRTGTYGTEPVFVSYQYKLGRKKICMAYVILKSYEYFVKDLPVAEIMFEYLEKSYLEGFEMEDVSKLALLRYYSRQVEMSAEQERIAGELLAEYNGHGMRFAFYQKFPRRLRRPYQLEDKVFLEYVANPKSVVFLHSRPRGSGEEYHREPMQNCFEGIYVKELILFYGEELECYIEEIRPDQTVRTSDVRVLQAYSVQDSGNSRYELLNRILKEQEAGDREGIQKDLETYRQLDYLTKEIFTLI